MPQGPLHHVSCGKKHVWLKIILQRKAAGAVTISQHNTCATCVRGTFERGVFALVIAMNVVLRINTVVSTCGIHLLQ